MAKKKKAKKSTVVVAEPIPYKSLRQTTNEVKEKEPEELDDKQAILLEKAIRSYVRKTGGYRKGLSNADKVTCGDLLRKRTGESKNKVEWDADIALPSDKPSVASIVQKVKD